MVERPLLFKNRDGLNLFGMMFEPEGACDIQHKKGVLISVNAVKYRLGTFRLHTLIARKLCSEGYYVFYFDPAGIGDSEGKFETKLLMEHYYDIQTGKYNNDLVDAIDYFFSQVKLYELSLFGLCGGAISVLFAGANDPRVSGLILLGIPVLLEDLKKNTGKIDHVAKITSLEKAHKTLAHKLVRLRSLSFWIKLIKMKVDLKEEARLVFKSVTVLLKKLLEKLRNCLQSSKSLKDLMGEPVSDNPRYNMLFQQSFAKFMKKKGKILFVFGEMDFTTWIFKSEFQDVVLTNGSPYSVRCKVSIIPQANHIFSAKVSQQQLYEELLVWLKLPNSSFS